MAGLYIDVRFLSINVTQGLFYSK